METYIPISFLNDFIFCPRSIYFHQLYGNFDQSVYQQKPQIAGKAAHESLEQKKYSTRKTVFTDLEVYSEKYRLHGKLDIYDSKTESLRERKREIKAIYDGYIYQLYAQYFCLTEMGYSVVNMSLYDMTHNIEYPIPLPVNDPEKLESFELLIQMVNTFSLEDKGFEPNLNKCKNCIYSNLCDRSLC